MTDQSNTEWESAWTRGWYEGQASTYCEQLRTGMRLAAEMSVPNEHLVRVVELVVAEGMIAECQPIEGYDRTRVWVGERREAFDLLRAIQALPDGDGLVGTFAIGVLFGYELGRVLDFCVRATPKE